MSDALRTNNLSGDALAFVNAGAASAAAGDSPAGNGTVPQPVAAPPAGVAEVERTAPRLVLPTDGAVPASRPVSMTFRLPADLPEALLRASMERKLRRQTPFAQQDIVAEAVRQWLRRHGWGVTGAVADRDACASAPRSARPAG
jgi:hypothetical protein